MCMYHQRQNKPCVESVNGAVAPEVQIEDKCLLLYGNGRIKLYCNVAISIVYPVGVYKSGSVSLVRCKTEVLY
jgi:hypothetical protein